MKKGIKFNLSDLIVFWQNESKRLAKESKISYSRVECGAYAACSEQCNDFVVDLMKMKKLFDDLLQ